MASCRVLIVEDDPLIATDVELALQHAGYEVCGIASSEQEALQLALSTYPDMAVVDVRLDPGDGRNVARELAERYNTTILMATAEDPASLQGIGAKALLPKPYDANLVAPALQVADALAAGRDPGALPDHLKALR